MLHSKEKEKILREAQFHYHFERSLYFNRQQRKVFSIEAIEDHDVDWLRDRVQQQNPGDEWLFFFNTPPSDSVKIEIKKIFQ